MLKNTINPAVTKIKSVAANPKIVSERNAVSKMLESESGIPKYGSIFNSLGLKPKFASKSWRG